MSTLTWKTSKRGMLVDALPSITMERRAMRIDDVLAVWTPAKTQGIRGLGFMAKRRPHLFVMLMMAHISEQSPKDIRLTHQVSKVLPYPFNILCLDIELVTLCGHFFLLTTSSYDIH